MPKNYKMVALKKPIYEQLMKLARSQKRSVNDFVESLLS